MQAAPRPPLVNRPAFNEFAVVTRRCSGRVTGDGSPRLLFPLGRKSFADPLTWHFAVDLGAIAVIVGAQVWTLVHIHRLVDPNDSATTGDVVLGNLLILAVLEATRPTVGW